MNTMIRLFVSLCCTALSILIPVAAAQSGRGSVSGHVTDTSGSILQGAEVELQPGTILAKTGPHGEYFINNLAPGTYTITITYVGFTLFTKVVDVASAKTSVVDAKMEVSSQRNEVLVTSDRPSAEAEEINRQRTADNVVQVLTNEVITSLPNANMADALGRLPSVTIERDEGEGKYIQVRGTEPRLTNATIDGVNVPSPESGVRQIKFDTIPADLVESVEINKTLQANMDGDGIGGSVNLVTKTATERPTVYVNGVGGYTPILGGRSLVETSGTVGQRFGSSKKFGILIGGSYDWNGRGIDDIEPVPDITSVGQRYFDSMDIREYKYYRSRWGLAGSADYKIAEGSNVYMRAMYSDFKNYGDRWRYTLNDNSGLGQLTPSPGPPSFNTQQRRPDYTIGSLLIGGKHVLATTWYAWDVSVSRSSQTGQVGDRNADFDATALDGVSNCTFSPTLTTSKYLPQWSPVCFTEAYNQANYSLTDVGTSSGLTAQLNLQFAGAMAKRYHLGSHLSSIEIGGKFRNAHKFDNTYSTTYSPNGSVPMTLFPNTFSNSDYYQGAYQLGPNPSFPDVFKYVNANLSDFTVTNDSSGNSNNYSLIEKVSAGYIMNSTDFSKVRLILGVRFEGTNLGTKAPLLDQDGNPMGQFPHTSGSYLNVLPSASVRYALTPNTNLRVVYSRGLARPNPSDIAQAGQIDPTVTPVAISLGNPNLKAEVADNFDLLFEHYLNSFGMLQAGYFYKHLNDPIVSEQFLINTGTFLGFDCQTGGPCQVSQSVNAGSAWLTGFEIAYLQHFSSLPGLWSGLGLSANYGYTASSTSGIPGRTDNPRLLRNAPNTWNISPTYDKGRFSVRLGLSYNQANIAAYGDTSQGINSPISDNYFYSHLQVDAQGSIRLPKGLSFVMYGLNLTNQVFGFYNGSPQYMLQREYYRPTIAAGMRWSPIHEK